VLQTTPIRRSTCRLTRPIQAPPAPSRAVEPRPEPGYHVPAMTIVDFGKWPSHRVTCGPFLCGLYLAAAVLAGCKDPMHGKTAGTGGGAGTGGLLASGGGIGASGAVGAGGRVGAGGVFGSGGAPDARPAFDAQACEALAATAATQFQTYLDGTLALSCQIDSDCKYLKLQSLNCFAACGLVIGRADTEAVTAAAAGACQPYVAAGCPEIRLACPAIPLGCQQGRCGPVWPGSVEPTPDASTARSDSAVDSAACSQPSAGAACTPEQTPCATCCTDRWSCVGGVWQNQFIGCLPTGFVCGAQTCSEGVNYCLHIPEGGGALPAREWYSCERLPTQCSGRRCTSCDCLKQAGISFWSCTSDATGAIYVMNLPY
jgi:hypothetical protein